MVDRFSSYPVVKCTIARQLSQLATWLQFVVVEFVVFPSPFPFNSLMLRTE
jgi:hypothetical protein